jgi:hypothetical protein
MKSPRFAFSNPPLQHAGTSRAAAAFRRLMADAFLATAIVATIAGPATASGASQQVRFAVPPVAYVTDIRHPATLAINETQLARGYVDVADASDLLISANVEECLLSIKQGMPSISRVAVRIDGSEQAVDTNHGVVAFAAKRGANMPMRITYRLYFNAGARPGVFPWPLQLSVAPKPA